MEGLEELRVEMATPPPDRPVWVLFREGGGDGGAAADTDLRRVIRVWPKCVGWTIADLKDCAKEKSKPWVDHCSLLEMDVVIGDNLLDPTSKVEDVVRRGLSDRPDLFYINYPGRRNAIPSSRRPLPRKEEGGSGLARTLQRFLSSQLSWLAQPSTTAPSSQERGSGAQLSSPSSLLPGHYSDCHGAHNSETVLKGPGMTAKGTTSSIWSGCAPTSEPQSSSIFCQTRRNDDRGSDARAGADGVLKGGSGGGEGFIAGAVPRREGDGVLRRRNMPSSASHETQGIEVTRDGEGASYAAANPPAPER
mmetsp:Transcript_39035/g.92084  ORF Transcript_39035/g.92084 Transcript_39035/m.92084 type:complete len:306 (+) Transcript_39035:157-1074(+)